MTTITFKEDLKINNPNEVITVDKFLDILLDNWYIPSLKELNDLEVTTEINSAFLKSKKSKNRINIM